MIYSSRTQADESAMVSDPASTEMMRRALAIACAALDEPETQRRRWAEEQCGNDATLRAEVVSLLAADETPERALERSLHEPEILDPWPGRLVGRYRVGERIGSGGMGTVYRAEPESGMPRQPVALKLIKRGMDTDEILRRFLREREILARLVHPNIARLLDGGMTVDGRPWFALELVDGAPLLEYCDDRRLPLPARASISCCRFATRSPTRTRIWWSIAISSRAMCWSRAMARSNCSTLGLPSWWTPMAKRPRAAWSR
ncbi:MAG: protein kinase [Rhodanobacteraceae bacterium]|nr:protein kinase [Rhodanobacteraceae bacterium]